MADGLANTFRLERKIAAQANEITGNHAVLASRNHQLAKCREELPRQRAEIDRLTAENKALKAMLKRLEWQGWAGAEGEYCTECGKDPDEGHVTGCRMAALLGEI